MDHWPSTYHVAFTILVIVMVSGCEKSQPSTGEEVGNFPVSRTILNPPVEVNNQNHTYERFDIDQNGSDDFEFSSYYSWAMNGGHTWYKSSISTLDSSFSVSYMLIPDTIFLHVLADSGSYTFHVLYNYYSDYNQVNNPTADSIVRTMQVKCPTKYSLDDQISPQHLWFSGELNFKSYEQIGLSYWWPIDYNYGNWDDQKQYFIVFRKKLTTGYKYGWFRINITDKLTIRIHEYAY